MEFSSLSVRRGVTFTMAYLMLVGFGLYSLNRLRLDLWPDIAFPTVIVITTYTGASPEDIETLITRPIEGAVSSAKDAEEIRSTSKNGVSLVEVKFDWGKDMELAETDVRRKLELVKKFLPVDADEPMVFAFDPSLQPILITTVSGPYPLDELRRIAEDDLEPNIVRLPGIASVEVAGGLEREIHVTLDPSKIAAFGLDVNAVVGAVYRENTQIPGGSIPQGALDFTIQTQGKYRKVEEIGEVVVGMAMGEVGASGVPMPQPIRLKEVAQVEDSFIETQRIIEVDGEPAVWLIVRKQSGANTVVASRALVEELPRIARNSAAEIEFKTIFNQSDFINQALGNLSTTALVGVVVVFLVLLFFLRSVPSALIVATAIPISVITTFAVMDQADMTLNILSMAGLALSIGMLVDNAIVVLENIFRLHEEGQRGWDAAINGAKQVSLAVTASTLTTVSVFVPILFVPGIAGVMFGDMAVTICFSLAVSLAVALTFIPLAASRIYGVRDELIGFVRGSLCQGERALALRLVRGTLLRKLTLLLSAAPLLAWIILRAVVSLVLRLLALVLFLLFSAEASTRKDVFTLVRTGYGHALDWTLRRRWIVGLGLGGALLGTAALAIALPTEFVTADDQSLVFVNAETPIGNNLDETYKVLLEVRDVIAEAVDPAERRLIALDIGVGKGFVAIFAKGVHAGQVRVPLVSMGKRERSQQQIEDAVREKLKRVPGLKATVAMPFNMMGGEGDVEVQILGHDLETSRTIGLELREQLLAMPEMSEVNYSMEDQKPEVRVHFDRPKLAQLGLSSAAVGSAISTYFMGKLAGRYAEGGDEFDIVVRYGKEHRLDIDELRKMPVATPTGQVVPLANVAEIAVGLGPVDITRLDQGRVTRLNCYLKQSWVDEAGQTQPKDLGGAIASVEAVLKRYPWPEAFDHHIGGTAEDFATSFKWLLVALLISVLLVYMVMASQFESLRQPFIIIFTVPLAAIGVILMFTLTRSTMDISSMIGVIMLVGIVVNNGIVMVDAANQLREQGLDRVEAIAKAARMRMRPILMTSITTILAMSPLALEIGEGAAGWGGMAKAVIGGLIAATVLTLFVVPTMYTVFASQEHKFVTKEAGVGEGGEA